MTNTTSVIRYKTIDVIKERADSRARQHKARKAALDALGGKCVRCGFADYRALQIDHINGNGGVLLRTVSWHRRYTAIIQGQVEGLQLLCANCNWIKRTELDENPTACRRVKFDTVKNSEIV